MASPVGHIIAARFLEMGLRRYRARVLALEASPAFIAWRRQGLVRPRRFPVMAEDCPNDVLGRFAGTGFRFACPAFAVTYTASPDLPATPAWHLMRHVSRRNRATWRLMDLVSRRQWRWLASGDELDLAPYPYAEVMADYRRRWPGSSIDASMISRLVRNRDVSSPQGSGCRSAICCRAAGNGSAGASLASSRTAAGIWATRRSPPFWPSDSASPSAAGGSGRFAGAWAFHRATSA